MSTMNSHSVGTLFEPVFGRRIPSYSENMTPGRLSQPQYVPGFMGKQFDGAYFSYKAQGRDITAFPASWSSTESSVMDRRSPVTHLSGIDRQHIYRKDSSSEETHPAPKKSPTRQGFTLYSKSPVLRVPQSTASVIVRNDQATGDRAPIDRPVYLTVPQAVYRNSPCCTDLCCVMGHGSPSLSNQAYEQSWKPGEPGDTLLQHRRLHSEGVSLCSPGQTRTRPAALDQTYSPTKVKEVSHGLQCSPRAFPSLYPSQPTYEHAIYHNRSPISKYGQTPQHPAYYYSPANVEAEKRTESKNTGTHHTQGMPVVLKHPIQTSEEHYMATSSLPRLEAVPNPSFMPGYDYSGYLVPRLNLNTSPIHNHPKHQRAVSSDYTNKSSKHVHRPIATLASVHRDNCAQPAEHSSQFVHEEQTSLTTCPRQPSNSQSQTRYCPPRQGAHLVPPSVRIPGPASIVAPAHFGLNMRPSRHQGYHVQPFFRYPHIAPTGSAVSNKTNNQRMLYCPPVPLLMEKAPNPSPSYTHKGLLKRAKSTPSPIKVPDDDDDDVFVVEKDRKRRRTEQGSTENKVNINLESSPPMPVINNVFSLAPYQAYLQLARMQLEALPQRLGHYSSGRPQPELTNEGVRSQPAVFKDVVSESAPEKDVLNTHRAKHRNGCTGPAGDFKGLSSEPPTAHAMIKKEKPESLGQQKRSDCTRPATLPPESRVKQECPDEPPDTAVSTAELLDLSKEGTNRVDAETKTEPKEQHDLADLSANSESEDPEQLEIIKKEPEELAPPSDGCMLELRKCKLDSEGNADSRPGSECGRKLSQKAVTPTSSPPLALSAPTQPDSKFNFLNIPPHCLKLSSYNIIVPEANIPRAVLSDIDKFLVLSQTPLPCIPLQLPVRKHFFELHQSLMKLISKSVAATSEETLKSWLSRMELNPLASSKGQKVNCLFGAKGREACLNEEMTSSLQKVVERLNEYTGQDHCPFPFVVRTGTIFLPMLVVKEVLFPSVHGALIDQVLQVHKVELRPTTLSEEKTLTQMHKRACSSRLCRLMSVKHLPDIYADVINLLYYTCVCKQLGLEMDDPPEADESCAGPSSGCSSPPVPPLSPPEDSDLLHAGLHPRKSRIKRSSRRFFLDCSSDEEQQASSKTDDAPQTSQKDDGSNDNDNSWMCPIGTEGDTPAETPSIQDNCVPPAQRTVQNKRCPGVILKLRRTCNRKRLTYRPVIDSERLHFESETPESELWLQSSCDAARKTPKVARWKRTSGRFCQSLQPLNAYSKRKLRSLLKIKYCPYLSACHSADYRRRWVLRSAVQRARRAMKVCYPDLVGRRIQHLYEEDDKSEVWYRGEVLRVHKASSNPLKTVFEVRYDSEPEWKYYLELLIDYKKGWLKIDD